MHQLAKIVVPVAARACPDVIYRRVASAAVAAGMTIVIAQAVQEVSKAIIEVKKLVDHLKKKS